MNDQFVNDRSAADHVPTSATPAEPDGRARAAYLAALERVPAGWEPHVRTAASRARIARRWVRQRRRLAARAATRRMLASSRWSRVYFTGERVVASLGLQRSPTVTLAGTGPAVVVDARGRTTGEICDTLASPRTARMLVIVDDPDLAPLRAVGLVYEYVPAPSDAIGLTRDDQERLVRERLSSWAYHYRVTRIATLDELPEHRPLREPSGG